MKPLTNTKTMPPPSARPALNRPPTAEERRRAQRVLLRIAVTVQVAGKTPIQGHTHTVSASGAMIILPEALPEGTKVTIENSKTQNKVEAKVARAPQTTGEGSLVPVEFSTPSPIFWNVFFPPSVN
ncbi:MAG: PilZ domain-containing protein [Candidatus Acidiferrum sp.]|jgi:c-di-GMP-binding flagellar brake protein YcgR